VTRRFQVLASVLPARGSDERPRDTHMHIGSSIFPAELIEESQQPLGYWHAPIRIAGLSKHLQQCRIDNDSDARRRRFGPLARLAEACLCCS